MTPTRGSRVRPDASVTTGNLASRPLTGREVHPGVECPVRSFWFRNAVPAVKQGFLPDSISTDLHIENFTILSYDNVLSKFASMGVPLNELIKRATVNPANEIHHPELGTLSVGKDADIAVLQELHGKFGFIDCGWARMDGDTSITARMTVRAGRIVYDPSGLSMVEWEKARQQYFTSPVLGSDKPSMADDFPRH